MPSYFECIYVPAVFSDLRLGPIMSAIYSPVFTHPLMKMAQISLLLVGILSDWVSPAVDSGHSRFWANAEWPFSLKQ